LGRYRNTATQFEGRGHYIDRSLSQGSGQSRRFSGGVCLHIRCDARTQAICDHADAHGCAEMGGLIPSGRQPTPTIASIVPAIARRVRRWNVVITGTGFLSGVTTVSFGDRIATSTRVDSSTRMTVGVFVDTAAAEGWRDVLVVNPPLVGAPEYSPARLWLAATRPHADGHHTEHVNCSPEAQSHAYGRQFRQRVTRVNMGPGVLVNAVSVTTPALLT